MNARDFVNQVNIQRRNKMSELEIEAALFAFQCHDGQCRKLGYEPYIVHPAEVASIVAQVTNDKETLAAAWLHDVVEDCGIDLGLIGTMFGSNVKTFVNYLTNPSQTDPELRKLNRMRRKQADREHMENAPYQAKTVKLADILSNINSLVYNDPAFARTWVKEKESLMVYLEPSADSGDVALYLLVKNNIVNSKEFLRI
jgi:(p)ppGpp synthase/HD superfamily hydrolase